MKQLGYFEEGQVLLINKPLHWTSFDVIRKIRNIIRVRKVGHAGTLDPLATGLLIVCTGKFTRRINEFMAQEKEYTGHFVLGATTPSFDLESKPEHFKSYDHISVTDMEKAASALTADIMQAPPAHYAIKVGGKRVYELAREGKEIVMEKRPVNVKEFQILSHELPNVAFRVVCSTGTYIRSLANDFGELLGCGAYLGSLCRTRIGSSRVEDAFTMEGFEEFAKQKLTPAH